MRKLSFLPLLACMLVACGSDALIGEPENVLSQQVYVLPSGASLSNDNRSHYVIGDTIYLEANQTYKFYAGYTLNDEPVNEASSLYASLLWELDGQFFNIESFQYAFTSSGIKKGFLETVDLYGDTVRTHFEVLVNTPNRIQLEYPANGYNQVERNNEKGIPLRWKTEGLDPWETAYCTIYASDEKDDIWASSLGTTDCNNNISLKGIVNEDLPSNTVYWAVSMLVTNDAGKGYTTTTDVFSFTTKTEEQSLLTIPVIYRGFPYDQTVNTEIILTNAAGDTLQVVTNSESHSEIQVPVEAQTGLHIYARDISRPEYTANKQEVDIPESTAITASTIYFTDDIPPQLAPNKTSAAHSDTIYFNVIDMGSGVNPAKIRVTSGSDNLTYSFRNSLLAIPNPCKYSCSIVIEGEDYANNPFPNTYWVLENINEQVVISGPFLREGF
ncbi:MAG: hypothetical protein Q4E52_00105 [Fibrobacter sp.]|nr:hypothetical protein [Fibrobacter sp.]MDO4945960.1 hypothetical protein [Fibrobacter sp.]